MFTAKYDYITYFNVKKQDLLEKIKGHQDRISYLKDDKIDKTKIFNLKASKNISSIICQIFIELLHTYEEIINTEVSKKRTAVRIKNTKQPPPLQPHPTHFNLKSLLIIPI